MASTSLQDDIEIPAGIDNLAGFRRWVRSDHFPEAGRIDYIRGRIEVDMSPEDLFTHGTLKVKLIRALDEIVEELDYGTLFSDRCRVSNQQADLSAEPDLVIVSHAAVDAGRVCWVPRSSRGKGRYVEIEGSPDVVIEIVSDSSEGKDYRRLPESYFDAGAAEFWLIDARGKNLVFVIHTRGSRGFVPAPVDPDGWRHSPALDRRFYLEREWHDRGYWVYRLRVDESV